VHYHNCSDFDDYQMFHSIVKWVIAVAGYIINFYHIYRVLMQCLVHLRYCYNNLDSSGYFLSGSSIVFEFHFWFGLD